MSDKACLFNLIVYTDKETQLGYLNEIIQDIVSKYPARVILIRSHDGETQIKKSPFKEAAFPLYDKVEVLISKKNLESISLFVLPYLITDYPIFLFFSGNPAIENVAFNSLIKLSNRLIVDSETSDNLQSFANTMINQIAKQKIEVCDVNWARISGWRLILANLFDVSHIQNLEKAKLIQILYSDATSLNQALYLQGWIAARLGWAFKEHKKYDPTLEYIYTHEDQTVLVHLMSKSKEKTDEAISTVQVTSNADQIYEITRIEDEPQVCVQLSSFDTCDIPYKVYFPNFNRGTSYLSQLLYSNTSTHYCEMLQVLKTFYA